MMFALDRFARGVRAYFGIAHKASAPAEDAQRKTTQFGDVQRRISIYLRALWGCEFVMKAAPPDEDGNDVITTYVENFIIHLPKVYRDFSQEVGAPVTGLEIYRAAATHAAAHIMYTQNQLLEDAFDNWQRAVIATIEDARVETLALRRFPGLKPLWSMQHTASPLQDKTAGDYLGRLARALLDESYVDDDTWVERGRILFNAQDNLEAEHIARDIGLELAQLFLEKKIKTKLRSDMSGARYRDDNRYLWKSARPVVSAEQELPAATFKFKGALLESNEVVRAGDNAKSSKEPSTRAPEIRASIAEPYVYSEWDFRSQSETPSWVTLREMRPVSGDLKVIDDIIAQHNHLLSRMKALLNAIRHGGVRRIRKLEEGDEIDVNAAIRARIDLRLGVQPDTRVMMRSMRKNPDISVLVLLDLSNSMNDPIKGQAHTALQLTREVCVLLADAIDSVGDPFAIHGFCSESRHNVEYFRFKDFEQAYDDVPKARIAGMTCQRATRMGAAIRHATHCLNQQKSGKKLLMIITDGAPSDVDVRGEYYLRHDARKAVDDADRSGINTYCINLDPKADEYVSRIFGARNYIVVDQIKSLPEKMLMLYAGLTR